MKLKVIYVATSMLFVLGCTHTENAKVKKPEFKSKVGESFVPAELPKEPQKVKEDESLIDIRYPTQEDIEMSQREYEQTSDYTKMMRSSDKRR
ncbi:MAG: hypothetical protein L3J43_08215 [Sulfurovum sp.]|nr:hypothetical protein [Sulfurovum sp.]